MTDCIFCKIAAGEMPATIVYQDEQAVAFEDISPAAPTHFLIIPRQHIAGPLAVDAEQAALVGHLAVVAAQVAREQGIDESGYRLVMNQGSHGGQSVFHIHMHLLGGRRLSWPPG